MATIEKQKNQFTVTEVARRFGRNPSRIRQICIQHDIGKLYFSRLRILNNRDVQRVEKVLEETGRKPIG